MASLAHLAEAFIVQLNQFQMHALPRNNNTELWNETAYSLAYLPVTYTNELIDYQVLYQNGQSDKKQTNQVLVDLSVILLNDGAACGIWPVSILIAESGTNAISFNSSILPPLYIENISNKTRRRMTIACINALSGFIKDNDITDIVEYESTSPTGNLTEWHKTLMTSGADINIEHELYVKLELSLPEIKSNLRKSYKALISSGDKLWQSNILDSCDITVWDEYRQLHNSVAGRKTRSDETWQMQYDDIKSGTSFLIYLRNNKQEMVGGGLFRITRDEALYSVGVYDRSLFDKPLGHVVQWKAIDEMKKRGLKWYKIGRRFYPSEVPEPSDKEISISYFKEGFSTHMFPKFVLRLKH